MNDPSALPRPRPAAPAAPADPSAPMGTPFAGVDFRRGRLFDTTDVDEARERCGRVFNPHQLRLRGRAQRLRARMDHLPLGGLSLNRLTWGARVAVDPDRLERYYLLSVPVAGRARFHLAGQAVDVTPRCAAVVNAAQRFHFEADEGFDQICVRFERAALEAAWQALTGRPPPGPLDLAVPVPLDGAAWRALAPVLEMLARAAPRAGTAGPASLPHLHARLEEMLLTTLLLHQTTLVPAAGDGEPVDVAAAGAAPAHLRRAQQHMQARLDEPLTASSVARACGIGVRTLQAAFQAGCGIGPMQWLRQQRLAAVHAALARGGAGARVTETALRFGFTHLGEFARAYRARYGEAPRETLRRG